MEIVHVTAECYPMAKAGGLGDVAGALPKYQQDAGHFAKVVMPMYRTKFLYNNSWSLEHEGDIDLGSRRLHYAVIKEKTAKLGFDLYLVDINGLLDREKIYGYDDDGDRFLAFQIAVCDWLAQWQHRPDVVHCHDHHTGLIPFMMQHCYAYRYTLARVPTVFTIHNAQYQGWMGWDAQFKIPHFDPYKWGLLDWKDTINPLASAIKCAWRVTTVSPSYLEELRSQANGLENLLLSEWRKSVGILNGIDADVWNPETDTMILKNYDDHAVKEGKARNKLELTSMFGLDPDKPLFTFIGRLVGEKAADILPDAIRSAVYHHRGAANFLILGSGDAEVEGKLDALNHQLKGYVNTYIGYNEGLSHLMYAGADFLLMPSRVEPCGLNQMYALRYGTVPMVRSTGGLKDTVVDMGDTNGYGIRFNNASVQDINYSVGRAIDLYRNRQEQHQWMRRYMMGINNSWESSSNAYLELYKEL